MTETTTTTKPVSTWRKVFAAILDFLLVFIGGGFVIGYLTGGLTDGGFKLSGGPAFVLFAAIVLYFIVFPRYLGGTVFQRLLGIR
ncbi:RDD family protein [Bradyrhizobium sp. U87765 SZCCT0131]|uniref:RDD family protein n=1 Tax=unclassified Bradyrhizobium TaxID=2631580 RepID=UPI001BAE1466|nr:MULTISPECIES: RDD family protein [unclassified Bradyrhizobium]MBR1222837.1 RDD family protein [Bradyrhizobium sp. U87765 SZCCT0131]MBR1262573.1 RDD family protein [Bradyrhizobium sp. U87765 SZCCT0134]MBR1308955.1 RDD family protein [Bradyrhizobium sp. U87765 SZCCT0110]MBR1318355.1 RDD family protein [Bradyrhizobium sp. U87765 SZCCT0109]MBR1352059.1 RDD family protein [Bradyrhizobium sp. U87765 SZCCT0048]